MMGSIFQRQAEKRRERRKRVDTDERLRRQKLAVSASRPIEHPCRKFQPTICSRPVQRAAKTTSSALTTVPCP
jgi:hypothetical protein